MTHPMILITIITEGLLKDKIADIIMKSGATGYTISRAEGEGSRGIRAHNWEGPNQKFQSIVTPEIADAIMEELAKKYFDHYAVIAWLSEVRVLRGEKFASK